MNVPNLHAESHSEDVLKQLAENPHSMEDYDANAMSVEKARAFISQFLNPISEVEEVPLMSALGRVLSVDILAPANVPNYDNSAMDGYAFNADSLTTSPLQRLTVIGTAFAGKAFEGEIKMGECVRIMTGAMMPKGADTVIAQENTSLENKMLTFKENIKRGLNVRYAGEDLKIHQTVISQGQLIRPADLGLIASLGVAKIMVYRKIKIAFFSTGDELASIDQTLKTGQVYDSNRYTLFGMLSRLGVEVIDLGAIPDDLNLLETTLLKAAALADVVITSGGVSVGEADFMKALLKKHGQVLFWKISMKPGRPLAYGKIITDKKSTHYFGLPGNPVAVMVTFYQFVRHALHVLMGQKNPPELPMFEVITSAPIKKQTGRTEFQRGICYLDENQQWKVKPTGAQGSAILSSMAQANCFIVLASHIGNLEAGALVKIQWLDGLI